ncbi:ECF transporter S component [Pseudarthrobacter sp. P1]|uniref:ECF transporter S component n=1 Tax=Pseudarthrobacter sp. P1 TaxID=3418418 RepID=UPI003CF2E673
MKNQRGFSDLMRNYGRLTIFMIPIGIATNFIGGQIAILLKLPMYLDSIGTILVGAVCGGLPGALVGLISNLINSITSPTLAPYATLSIMFGLLAGWLSKHGVFKSLWKTLLSSIPFALIGSILGSLLTIWIFGGLGGSGGALIVGALVAAGMDLNTAVFTAAIPMDFLDKIPTVLVVFLILKRIPTRLFVKLPLGHVYLNKATTPAASITADEDDDELALGR